MITTEWLFDVVLGVLLLVLATAALHARTLYASAVLFIAFGLLLALTWARLGAPDLALAEAAIGAGLTGALLLSALARTAPERQFPLPRASHLAGAGGALLALLLLGLLIRAVWPLSNETSPLVELVYQRMPDSGVEHPVTAVLLNFRSWDTLLEILVLLAAVLGARQLVTKSHAVPEPWPLLLAWSRWLAPLTVLVGGYILWRGATAPGGAFQAGSLLAAGAVVLYLNHLLPPLSWSHWLLRALVLIGVGVFLGVGALCAWLGAGWLVYPPAWSGPLIVLIEIAATLSIAVFLTLLVVGIEERQQ